MKRKIFLYYFFITQAFLFSFLLLRGRIFGKTTQPFLFAIFPAASFKLSLICVTHMVCHRLHQWRPARQFVLPTQFTFQMLALGAHAPLYFLQLSPAPQDRCSSAVPHQVTKGNWMLLSHLKHPLASSYLGGRFIVKSEKVTIIPLFFSPELREVLVGLSMRHTQLLWPQDPGTVPPTAWVFLEEPWPKAEWGAVCGTGREWISSSPSFHLTKGLKVQVRRLCREGRFEFLASWEQEPE